LEDNLKQYTDNLIPDLSDYATKEYVDTNEPYLSSCLAKTDMFYEGDPTNETRIKYNSNPDDGYNQKNNIYIGGSCTGTTLANDYQSVIIGYGSKNTKFRNSIAIGAYCNNNTPDYIKFWTGNDLTTSSLTGVQFGNIIW
jgi:hypothetical protein